ncbi:MAG TPA: hypothetical protein VFN20_10990 [Candidatus Acidoferrum sp.]|nr:hypothetical protein [Candidatus Acidoferrum sp.]
MAPHRTPKRWLRRGFAASVLILAFGFTLARAQKKDSSGALQPDKGKFSLLVDGKSMGQEEFEIAPSGAGWLARGTTTIKSEKGDTKVTGNLALQPNGAPISYDWTAQTDKTNGAHILFTNGVAKITLEMQGSRPYEQDLSFGTPLVIVLDNNLYHQYAVLARIYDWSKGGAQQLPVLIPQELTPGSITLEATGSASAGGKSYEGLKVTTGDLEILLLLDNKHKLMRIEVPSAKVSVVRD